VLDKLINWDFAADNLGAHHAAHNFAGKS